MTTTILRSSRYYFLFFFFIMSLLLSLLLILPSCAAAQNQKPIFQVTPEQSLMPVVDEAVIGDFNGDGKPDLAYINYVGAGHFDFLNVYLSVGSNAPSTVTTQLCNEGPIGSGAYFAVGDVNHDGKLDVVFNCDGYVSVMLGNGDGTFAKPVPYAVNAQGTPVLVDLSGDGYLDIVFIYTLQPTTGITVLLNEGSRAPGIYGAPQPYTVPSSIFYGALASGDFNGDGKQDLIASADDGGFFIFYGKGDGTLQAAQTYSSGASVASFVTGDFNHDGITDVAFITGDFTLYTSLSVQLLLGNTSGTLTQGVTLPLIPYGEIGTSLSAGALTSDGNLDLIVSNLATTIFRGDGEGGFSNVGSYAASGATLIADVNTDGKPDLLLLFEEGFYTLQGNGDGTFQGIPTTPISFLDAYPPVLTDVNGDGIADALFVTPQQSEAGQPSYFMVAALGRGDGRFAVLSQSAPLPAASIYTYSIIVPGDFNGDGKTDAVLIAPGAAGGCLEGLPSGSVDAQLVSYLGSGVGTFQLTGTAMDLGVPGAGNGVAADFNGDGKLDLIVPYNNICAPEQNAGLLFLAGHGDGAFDTPVTFGQSIFQGSPNPLVGDLRHNGKLDVIWNDAVFLGNGDGTFKQIPLNLPALPITLALGDVNGDGYPDLVATSSSGGGVSVYAGNGDGTFQTTPLYTTPDFYSIDSATIGDVNADGKPDLVVLGSTVFEPEAFVFLGDGKGDFTPDNNVYFAGNSTSLGLPVPGSSLLTRLNNQAPALPKDSALDIFAANSGGLTVLLNLTNPAPKPPAPITSVTSLQASATTGNVGTQITLTAAILGTSPTGTVSFDANGTTLGTITLTNGTATLETSFVKVASYSLTAEYLGDSNNTSSTSNAVTIAITPAASTTALQVSSASGNENAQLTLTATVTGVNPTGSVSFTANGMALGTAALTTGTATLTTTFANSGSYSVVASYSGDANNTASTSAAVTISIIAPDFTVAANPTSMTIQPGQSATYTLTMTAVGGYSGTVKLSCAGLPSEAACTFSPGSLMSAAGSAVTSTLTITTTAAMSKLDPESKPARPSPGISDGVLALGAILGIFLRPRRARHWNQLLCFIWLVLILVAGWSLIGCGGGNGGSKNAGTPQGTSTIMVNAADQTGGPQHSLSLTLVVQ